MQKCVVFIIVLFLAQFSCGNVQGKSYYDELDVQSKNRSALFFPDDIYKLKINFTSTQKINIYIVRYDEYNYRMQNGQNFQYSSIVNCQNITICVGKIEIGYYKWVAVIENLSTVNSTVIFNGYGTSFDEENISPINVVWIIILILVAIFIGLPIICIMIGIFLFIVAMIKEKYDEMNCFNFSKFCQCKKKQNTETSIDIASIGNVIVKMDNIV